MKRNVTLGSRPHAIAEEHWIPLSDLMTGLMMLFLLLAISYMLRVQAEAHRAQDIAVYYDKMRVDLYRDLENEFHNDLPRWNATIDQQSLTVSFHEPEVLFQTGSAEVRPRFKNILADFFPRYVAILMKDKYRNSIEEVRIEGYTSTLWHPGSTVDEAYFGNMELSQARTRNTLGYVLDLSPVEDCKTWLMEHVTANGLSFSHLVRKNGVEDQFASQRVDFQVRTDADERIKQIRELGSQ
jgi:outer membrane protein OmpA-like peptidoglycan-associated protein